MGINLFSAKYKRVSRLPELLQRISVLLNEGYTLLESMEIVLPFHTKDDRYWHEHLQRHATEGASVVKLFQLIGLEQKQLFIVEIAEKTGTLASTLGQLGMELSVQSEAKRKTKHALMYPLFLFCSIFILFFLFRQYFLPNMERMMMFRESGSVHSMGLRLSKFFLKIPDTILITALIGLVASVMLFYFLSKKSVAFQIRFLLALPVVQYVWRLFITREFALILGRLLMYGWSIQDSLKIIKEQSYNRQLSFIAAEIERRILFGDSFSEAVKLYDYFSNGFERFTYHGEKIGQLGKELVIYADLLGQKINSIAMTTAKIVQPMMLVIIAICVIAAYLSIILPMYNMLEIV